MIHILPDSMSEALDKYFNQTEKELEHPEAIGGLAGRMFFEGWKRWGEDWNQAVTKKMREGNQ